MTDVVGSAAFELRATNDKLKKDVEAAARDLKRSMGNVEREYGRAGRDAAASFGRGQRQMVQDAERAERDIRKSARGISTALAGAAGVLAGSVSATAIIDLSDSYTRFANSLKVAGVDGAAFGQVQERLAATAIRNGIEIETLGALYGRAAQSAGELGASQSELLQFTDGVSAAIRVQGATTAQASGAILQLSQALAGGTIRAEEFNAINEGARPILQAVASGSDRFRGSVAALRAEVLAGTVTSQEFFTAFLRGSADLEKQAAKAPLTVAAGFTNLRTALTLYVGESAAAKGSTEALSGAVTALANNLDVIIPSIAAIVAGVGTAYVAGSVAAIATTANFAKALGGLRVAMTLIATHPIVAVLSVIAAGLAFVTLRGGEAAHSTQELAEALDAEAKAAAAASAETTALGTATDDARVWAAALTGEVDKLAEAHYRAAAAAKAQAIEVARLALVESRTRLESAMENADSRRATLRGRAANELSAGARSGIDSSGRMLGTGPTVEQQFVQTQEFRVLTAQTASTSRAVERLNALMGAGLETFVPRPAAAAPSLPAGARGGAGAIGAEAQRLDTLRAELDQLTESLLTDTERATIDLAAKLKTIRDAVAAGLLTETQGRILEGGAASQDLQPFAPTPLGPMADGRQIADDIAAGLRAQQDLYDFQGREMARSFVSLLESGDIGGAIGARFREAAFDRLEDALSEMFSALFAANGGGKGGSGGGWIGAALKSADSFFGFARGGHVRGPGSATSDSIPSLLSNGEFVINAASTSRHRGLLEAINAGWSIPGYAAGGLITTNEAGPPARYYPL